jgi:hypothetical protein
MPVQGVGIFRHKIPVENMMCKGLDGHVCTFVVASQSCHVCGLPLPEPHTVPHTHMQACSEDRAVLTFSSSCTVTKRYHCIDYLPTNNSLKRLFAMNISVGETQIPKVASSSSQQMTKQ